jgi:hypothetical protein
MKNTLKPLPSFVAEEKPEDDIAWLQRQLEGEDDALTRAYRLGYQDGKRAFRKDKERLDWILNNYTMSCGITREEVDEKMAELRKHF